MVRGRGTSKACQHCQHSLRCLTDAKFLPGELAGYATYCVPHSRVVLMGKKSTDPVNDTYTAVLSYPLWMKPGFFMENLAFSGPLECVCDCDVGELCPLVDIISVHIAQSLWDRKLMAAAERLYAQEKRPE